MAIRGRPEVGGVEAGVEGEGGVEVLRLVLRLRASGGRSCNGSLAVIRHSSYVSRRRDTMGLRLMFIEGGRSLTWDMPERGLLSASPFEFGGQARAWVALR